MSAGGSGGASPPVDVLRRLLADRGNGAVSQPLQNEIQRAQDRITRAIESNGHKQTQFVEDLSRKTIAGLSAVSQQLQAESQKRAADDKRKRNKPFAERPSNEAPAASAITSRLNVAPATLGRSMSSVLEEAAEFGAGSAVSAISRKATAPRRMTAGFTAKHAAYKPPAQQAVGPGSDAETSTAAREQKKDSAARLAVVENLRASDEKAPKPPAVRKQGFEAERASAGILGPGRPTGRNEIVSKYNQGALSSARGRAADGGAAIVRQPAIRLPNPGNAEFDPRPPNRADAAVSPFAKLDSKRRQRLGPLSTAGAPAAENDGLAKALAGKSGVGREAPLERPHGFQGVNAIKDVNRKASEAFLEARRKASENADALATSLRELNQAAPARGSTGRMDADRPSKREEQNQPDPAGRSSAASDAASAAYISAENTDTMTGELITAIKEMAQKNEDGLKRLRDEIPPRVGAGKLRKQFELTGTMPCGAGNAGPSRPDKRKVKKNAP